MDIINLGKQGETNVRQVQLDVSRLVTLFGPGTVQLLHRRPGDVTPYPVALTRTGDVVTWTINAADTAYAGEGQAELQYFVGDSLAKSETYATVITASLGDAGEAPPEPQAGWVTQVLQAGNDAAEAAERAENAVLHPPIIGENGNWWLWSFADGIYVDSGTPAAGGSSENAVLYTEQELSGDQRAQARENIGAVSMVDVKDLLGIEEEFSASGEVVELKLDLEPGTGLEVVSKIHRDETWGLANTLTLHHVSGVNFFDMSEYLGGAGTVFSQNGLTATINADSTLTIRGTNENTGYTYIINKNKSDDKIYPAGAYVIPSGFMMQVRAATWPTSSNISGATGNLSGKVTIPASFRVVSLVYVVGAGATVDVTLPIGLWYGGVKPEVGYEYAGNIYTTTFLNNVYDGEYNWATGELKDVNGNIIEYCPSQTIESLPGVNYFWTGFGENTVSNEVERELGKTPISLDETAPDNTVPSICDFMLTPTTPEAAYGLYFAPFLPNGGQFYGKEVPVLTTKGTLSVKDKNGNTKYGKYIGSIFNTRGVADTLTQKGLEKRWSEKFYLSKEPVSVTISPPSWSGPPDAYIFVWEFDESEFVNTGIPAKIHDIAMASPCFINNDSSESNVQTQTLWNGDPYPAFFSYDSETGKYTLTARGIQGGSIMSQLKTYSKVYFYYQLETPYNEPFAFAMGIDAGDTISFDVDLADNQLYIDALGNFRNKSVEPSVTAFVPRNVEDAMAGMTNAAIMLNMDDTAGGDATVQGYSWIGAGDGATDYTTRIQSKLDELHGVTNGGTIHLGPGTYPISNSLIVYSNTQIVGTGRTVIEQRADNTHAVIWSGSNIRMSDLTIRLAGDCTELTACVFVNSDNMDAGNRDTRYPENVYAQFCGISNVVLSGEYRMSWQDGNAYLSEEALAYRGVGMMTRGLYFNYFDCAGLRCQNLYAGIYRGGGSCNYRIYVVDSRYMVYIGGGNNVYEINGHSYYDNGPDETVVATDAIYYGVSDVGNKITIGVYDTQYVKLALYFDGSSHRNIYEFLPRDTSVGVGISYFGRVQYRNIEDYGRANCEVGFSKESVVGVGSRIVGISGLPYWNTQFNPCVNNALAGAGVWGTVTSNKTWTENGMSLMEVCRYPKETGKDDLWLASVVCDYAPSESDPVEVVIDISDRPITAYRGIWIQFDHRFVAEDYEVSFDTKNDGTFGTPALSVLGNNEPVSYQLLYQTGASNIYRIKISITKALQIPEFYYETADNQGVTITYNPDGLIGIVNIGMPSNEAYGRAFLGECGGSLYGNVDMHQNTLKNIRAPVDDGDAVSKAYLEERLAALEALINGT